MDKKLVGRRIKISLVLALICALLTGAISSASEPKQVRVGFFAFDGYHMQNSQGKRSGYGYELLQHLAGYLDWQFEYVGYDKSWSEMQEMLAAGEIDLVSSAQKTPEREKQFSFSDVSVGTSSAILTVRSDDMRYFGKKEKDWDRIRVGMITGNSRNESFAEYASNNEFTYESVFYDNTTELISALKENKEVDAILTSNLRSLNNERILAQFNPSPFYIMLNKNEPELLSELDYALGQLCMDEPEFRTQLMEKYYSPDNGKEIAFSVAERDFIAANADNSFSVLINPDRVPFSYLLNDDIVGIMRDIADLTAKRSGLHFHYLLNEDRAAYNKMVEEGKADIIFDLPYDFNNAELLGYKLTLPYLETSLAKLQRRNDAKHNRTGMLANSILANKYGYTFSQNGSNLKYYGSMKELNEALLASEIDQAILYYRTALYLAQSDETNRLESDLIFGVSDSFVASVNNTQNPLLFSILKKTLLTIGDDDLSSLITKNTSVAKRKINLKSLIYNYPMQVLAGFCVLFMILVMAALLIRTIHTKRQQAENLIQEKRRATLLADALAAAEMADAAKSRFLSRVSHEMRTPLNAIIGFLSLTRGASEEQKEVYLRNSESAAKQLLAVINDVLDMSAIDSGKLKLAHTLFDFKSLIHSLTDIYVLQCSNNGLNYETQILTPVEEWLIGDQLRLNQILINLLGNAVKFTEKGEIRLLISQKNLTEDKVFLRFEVVDSGCGMNKEQIARLFQPFEQGSDETAQKYGGNGLGLSIVKSLVSLMGGAISVTSEPGEGSHFVVDLPFTRSVDKSDYHLPENIEKLHVLAVDDESSEREYISTVLTRLGIRYNCVESGQEAIEALDKANEEHDLYNICLVDWRMPGISGLDTTRIIREKYDKDVVIIIISAYEQHQVGAIAIQNGANIFLPKPVFQSSLYDLFMTLTGGSDIDHQIGNSPTYDFKGKRVLLAEDNSMNRMVAEGLLKKYGIEVESCTDGKGAVIKFTSSVAGYYDAILMDIQMPNMNGIEATKAIRNSDHPEADTIQIIALSADAFNEDISRTFSSGMNAHVSKPIEPKVLANALKTAFEANKARSKK